MTDFPEVQLYKDLDYNFYTYRNPKYFQALKQSATIAQNVRKTLAEQYEKVTSNISLIGDPIEKAQIATEETLAPVVAQQAVTVFRTDKPIRTGGIQKGVPSSPQLSTLSSPSTNVGDVMDLDEGVPQIALTLKAKVINMIEKRGNIGISSMSLTKNKKNEILIGSVKLDITEDTIEGPNGAIIKDPNDAILEYLITDGDQIANVNIKNDDLKDVLTFYDALNIVPRKTTSKSSDKAIYLLQVMTKRSKDYGLKGYGIRFYKSPSELCDRLYLIIGSKQAGNSSVSLKNEGLEIVNTLLKLKVISKPEYKLLMQKLV